MQATFLKFFTFLCLLSAAVAQPVPIILQGQVWDGNGGPLVSGQVYHITSGLGCGVSIPVGETLTIQPGAIVKVQGCWYAAGLILAQGTATQPIIFTSIHDDAAGGDTNGNGNLTLPAAGDWNGIEFIGSPSVFEHCHVSYGGNTNGVTFDLRGKAVTFRHCVIEWSAGHGMNGAAEVTVEDCEFRDLGGIPVVDLALRSITQFTDNTAVRCDGGEYARIVTANGWAANETLEHRFSINSNGVFVFDMPSSLSPILQSGASWTIPAGTVLKFERGLFQSRGDFEVLGTPSQPVVFTSLQDDTYGGDTQKDGNATAPQPGDWSGIELFADDAATIQHAIVRYAANPAIEISGSSATIEDTIVEHGSGDGFRFGNTATPPAAVRRCTIRDNGGRSINGVSWTGLAELRDNVATNNAGGNEVSVNPDRPDTTVEIVPECFPGDVLVVTNGTIVNPGGLLIIPAGTILKFSAAPFASGFSLSSGGLHCNGTARRPVVMTSWEDDSYGGDTNLDGAATAPAPGDWKNIFASNGVDVRLTNTILRYPRARALEARSSNGHYRQVRVEHGEGTGILIAGAASDFVNPVVVGCDGNGIELNNGSVDVLHATVVDNTGAGFLRTGGWTGTIRNSISWNNTGGNFSNVVAGEVFSSNGDFAGLNGNIATDPMFGVDLELSPASPCLNAGDLIVGLTTERDYLERSRVTDSALSGIALPDMGAYEAAAFSMDAQGDAVLGSTMTFTLLGPPGVGTIFLGFQNGIGFLPPLGVLLTGATSFALVPSLAVGQPLVLNIPTDPNNVGLEFAVQGVALQGASLIGNFTNADRSRVRM